MRILIPSSRVIATLLVLVALGACGPDSSRGRGGGGGNKPDLKLPGNDNEDVDMTTEDPSGTTDLAPVIVDDAGACGPGQTPATCSSPIANNAGCTATEVCGNGADDDCNGMADDGCACVPGEVQKCFNGPPGKRGKGACTDGTQTCEGSSEFPAWGPCVGAITPSSEVCDDLDNDCNGCPDDGLCCGNVLSCPAPGDPRIAAVAPYSDKLLNGGDFFNGSATKWTWTVEGGPCDKLFASPDFTPKISPTPQSFTLTNGNKQNAKVHFTLSGDYTVTLTVVDSDGETHTCKWVQHVQGPGVRVELCWDHQGGSDEGGADLDLHVHKYDGTATSNPTPYFMVGSDYNITDCFFGNCTADANFFGSDAADFGYGNSNINNCKGSKNGTTWQLVGYCANPRLDLDNISEIGVPENTNIDNPGTGDAFRAAVHYFGQDADTSTNVVNQHPIVNIYCGGTLKATYGQAPNTLPDGFNFGMGTDSNFNGKGMIWRVADVEVTGADADGNTTCDVTALHPEGSDDGYWVNTDKNNTDFSY